MSILKKILEEVDLEVLEFTVAADIKMLMILVGKSGGKPKFGCPYCSACTPFDTNGVLYTIGRLIELNYKFVKNGSKMKKQQLYENVTNPPLVTGSVDDLILKMFAIPELHLLIGVVDKLLTEFENRALLTKKAGRKFMDRYLK